MLRCMNCRRYHTSHTWNGLVKVSACVRALYPPRRDVVLDPAQLQQLLLLLLLQLLPDVVHAGGAAVAQPVARGPLLAK